VVKVYGHPRSGCNFAVNFIASAFYPEIAQETKTAWTGHWSSRTKVEARARKLWGSHKLWHGQENGIHIVRNVKDMALSMHRTKQFQHPSWHELDFSAFIRKPLDWYETPGHRASCGLNIIEHWCSHVSSWYGRDNVLLVHYEDLVTSPGEVIAEVSEFIGREPVNDPDMSLAGPFPSNNIGTDKWKGAVSEKDLRYIDSIIKGRTWRLWD